MSSYQNVFLSQYCVCKNIVCDVGLTGLFMRRHPYVFKKPYVTPSTFLQQPSVVLHPGRESLV